MSRQAKMGRSSRPAASLLEVLVVIAILAVILALLFPAVQKVREAAARLDCTNHLRQIALAFQHHHDVHSYFPSGGTHLPPRFPVCADLTAVTPAERLQSWSWAYAILPFLELEGLYQTADPQRVQSTPVVVYYCPTRRRPELYDGTARIDYAANAGSHPEGLNGLVMRTPHGVVRLRDVLDGTSHTVLVGEKRLNRAMLGVSVDDNEAYVIPGWNDDWDVYRWGAEPPAADVHRPGDSAPSRVFGSAHPGGFSAAFVDGSVRFVRYSIDPLTWQRACVRNDRQSDSLNE